MDYQFTISEQDRTSYKRLDHFLSDKCSDLSRTFIKKLYENNLINSDHHLELKKMPPTGTTIYLDIPEPTPIEALPEDIPLEILFEDDHLIVINKQAGLVVHPAPGNYTGTLVNALLFHCKDLAGIGGKLRPGIVHRLDKGTTGVMIAAKSSKAMENLIITFQKHDIKRQYEALVLGTPVQQEGKLESTIGRHPKNRKKMATHSPSGKNAITFYRLLKNFGNISHLELTLETGRTHQIRVHLSSLLKIPILGDQTYADINKQKQILKNIFPQFLENYSHPLLHAKSLGFAHPITGEQLHFSTPAPEPFQGIIQFLEDTKNDNS